MGPAVDLKSDVRLCRRVFVRSDRVGKPSFPGHPIVQSSLKPVGKFEGVVTAHFLDFVCRFGGKLVEDQFERVPRKGQNIVRARGCQFLLLEDSE